MDLRGPCRPKGRGTEAPCTVASCTRRKLTREIEERLLGERLAAEAELQDGHVGGAVTDDQGRRRPRRHDADDRSG